MKRTKEESEQTRQELLDTALLVFSQKGYQAARLEDIAATADVTRGAIYHHFGNKAGLFMGIVEMASAQSNRAIQRATKEGGTLSDVLARILLYTLTLLEEDAQFAAALQLSMIRLGDGLAEYKQHRSETALALIESVAAPFQQGIAQGELRDDVDPLNMARAFLAFQKGVAMIWLADPDAFSLQENATELVQLFMGGVITH